VKTINKENGQIFEIIQSRKEAATLAKDIIADTVCNGEWLDEDSSLYIKYKDGSEASLVYGFPVPRLKISGIAAMHWNNAVTDCFYNGKIAYNEHYEDYEVELQ
jgi:hypothetical protein